VEENCADCHSSTLSTTFLLGAADKNCTKCHPHTGHSS
jgi:hypothetical protein